MRITTLQECKDLVAQSRDCKDWSRFMIVDSVLNNQKAMELAMEEAAEMYAKQFIDRVETLEAAIWNQIEKIV